tara:strand:- start:4585 stop:4743 length:159 start_codon:yes stop_codon:yes gene_type:complete
MQGDEFVSPDDIRAVVHDCLRHRASLSYEANAEKISIDTVLNEILKQVALVA